MTKNSLKKKIDMGDVKTRLLLVGGIIVLALVIGIGIFVIAKQRKPEKIAHTEATQVTEIEPVTELVDEETEKKVEVETEDIEVTENIIETEVEEEAEQQAGYYDNYVPPLVWEKRPNSGQGFVVCIDPGHQISGDSTLEPNAPGSDVMKARVTGGTRGTYTGVYEYELNLAIALGLRAELESRGYTVYMTRETHDINISNMERAQFATEHNADITVRIHANGSNDGGVAGALALSPSTGNPYVSAIAPESLKLSQKVLDYYCSETGFRNRGVQASDTMTGINWCTMPVTILEMGFMSNYDDDVMMQDGQVQARMITGIANGIDAYFAEW